jgi:LacI family transcriptional regulator
MPDVFSVKKKEDNMVSIRDVAKHAGVAISTVSKVVNNYPNVSEETKKKVNASIKELNFIPNTIASALSSKQAGRVALLMNLSAQIQSIDEIGMQYLVGAIDECRELGLDVITVFHSVIRDKSVEEMEQYFRSQSISGIIIFGMSKEDKNLQKLIEAQSFKIVTVDAPYVNEHTSSVWIDQKKAQKDVAKKTIMENAGNRSDRILYISGKDNGYITQDRTAAMKELAEEMGLKLAIYCGEFSEYQARKITFQHAKEHDIIVCASDMMAIGAMKALIEMDIFKPVCGFDGITLMGYVGKQMYTVQQDFASISTEAVKELARLMNGGVGSNIVLPHEIVRIRYEDIIL